jgi:hypothetical protein
MAQEAAPFFVPKSAKSATPEDWWTFTNAARRFQVL